MAQVANISLSTGIRSFGARAFELTRAVDTEVAQTVRRTVAETSRAYGRALVETEPRRARRALELAFKCLGDAVNGLDALARDPAADAVLASALAAEGTNLCESLYDLISER